MTFSAGWAERKKEEREKERNQRKGEESKKRSGFLLPVMNWPEMEVKP
jgi:hypothetical protein